MAEEEVGLVLIVLGIVLMAIGVFLWPICAVGFVLLIVGVILYATERSRIRAYAYPGYGYPGQPPYGYPPPPGVAAPAPPPPAQPGQPLCPVCGSALMWVPQYGRWYCSRCVAYR
jgi:predicted membrane channel-forming protein YqfA (hemolysin III family)